jgi:hypothetical protein
MRRPRGDRSCGAVPRGPRRRRARCSDRGRAGQRHTPPRRTRAVGRPGRARSRARAVSGARPADPPAGRPTGTERPRRAGGRGTGRGPAPRAPLARGPRRTCGGARGAGTAPRPGGAHVPDDGRPRGARDTSACFGPAADTDPDGLPRRLRRTDRPRGGRPRPERAERQRPHQRGRPSDHQRHPRRGGERRIGERRVGERRVGERRAAGRDPASGAPDPGRPGRGPQDRGRSARRPVRRGRRGCNPRAAPPDPTGASADAAGCPRGRVRPDQAGDDAGGPERWTVLADVAEFTDHRPAPAPPPIEAAAPEPTPPTPAAARPPEPTPPVEPTPPPADGIDLGNFTARGKRVAAPRARGSVACSGADRTACSGADRTACSGAGVGPRCTAWRGAGGLGLA